MKRCVQFESMKSQFSRSKPIEMHVPLPLHASIDFSSIKFGTKNDLKVEIRDYCTRSLIDDNLVESHTLVGVSVS